MSISAFLVVLTTCLSSFVVNGLKFEAQYEGYNLNENETATNPLDYSGKWNHTYNTSPPNWRFPFYTLFLDRFVNGDPSNDNANDTFFEQDIMSTQLRHGGDIQGLVDSLDYIQGMGIKAIYVAGSPFINQPWEYDSYSPLDHTLLDFHFGNITQWRSAIQEIHDRGMYIVLDNTVATMGDLIAFDGYMNASAPFKASEYSVQWKSDRRYLDFDFGTDYNKTCDWPRMWNETGMPVDASVTAQFSGCYDGDFDQMGDTEAFGVHPDYQRQLTKFASVQDRLREWEPSVMARLQRFSCMTIEMLDIDGFRYDKATQSTLDAEGEFSASIRECASNLGKSNFFIPGEITGGNYFGSLYIGRGRQADQWLNNLTAAVTMTNVSMPKDKVLRAEGQNALDAAAFHYSVYRYLTRFLGMDGNLEAGYDLPPNWVDAWNEMLYSNDFVNANTGNMDVRHMYGTTNQDVFRWPAIEMGTDRMLLGQFITTLELPGIPLLLWGEEQAFYVLDNTADNYIYGRQAMSSSPAWQAHGCYSLDSAQYYKMPLDAARTGCSDETVSYDHRDPSHPVRNIIKHMYQLREDYPALKEGLLLQQLSNQTEMIQYPGSNTTKTETGLWSVMRAPFYGVQDFEGSPPVWLVYHNRNETKTYSFDCGKEDSALISPFDSGTTVKSLIFPHPEMDLADSPVKLGINGSTKFNGCYHNLTLAPYEFRAYVPAEQFVPPPAMITRFVPGHDARIPSKGTNNTVNVAFHVSAAMDCSSFTKAIEFSSITETGQTPSINLDTVQCQNTSTSERASYVGALPSAWSWSADIVNLSDGVHQITVRNATTQDLGSYTDAVDRFLIRIGAPSNPLAFPATGNYSDGLLSKANDGTFSLTQSAPGASKYRYSLDWGSSWSGWTDYKAGTVSIGELKWQGTKAQEWEGDHVIVQYWSQLLGSSSFVQHGDVDFTTRRRLPHIFAMGPFNQYGYDAGLKNEMALTSDSKWDWHFMAEWPAKFQLNVWGMNPDGQPDQTFVYGDIDGDFVLDRMPPSSLVSSTVNVSHSPSSPYLSYRVVLDDGTLRYQLVPQGNRWVQLALWLLLWIVPAVSGTIVVMTFKGSFYKIKFNEFGLHGKSKAARMMRKTGHMVKDTALAIVHPKGKEVAISSKRRCVLIATMEYNIDDWAIKIKIGGLGVMAQLMGKSLKHQDLIWVVPCVGGIDYPMDTPAEPMFVKILNQVYEIKVQYHKVENITYVLLDAPVFRKQTKSEPYPPRMDDLESAIYYSAWNQCIAETIKRFPIDLYHINDYHGAAALLYLLPRTLPACLSLHNAEFQGMWPMRTPKESKEVCEVFNLSLDTVQKYIQFGSVFNLLHAGASYLRIHQRGFGAVGVSKKYGDRSFARYPIFWGLSRVGQLPNPDPTDTEDWDKDAFLKDRNVTVDQEYEAGRTELKRQAQEWAGLEQNPKAELFVFVGRWSLQKGVDLIADIFPTILEQYRDTQLICIGPVIDLYGKFAALKLSKLMEKYPKRVFSKPEFTVLPPYIFSGAEFALIPSRDEPFGLVAVEFGRKGALGVGARVGGLGQMPGWWYTVESTSASHLLSQFKEAITSALETDTETRALMRAWSAKQRFPVAQWIEKLEKLQRTAIKIHQKHEHGTAQKKLLSKVRDRHVSMQSVQSVSDMIPPSRSGPQEWELESLPRPRDATPSLFSRSSEYRPLDPSLPPSTIVSPRGSPPQTPGMSPGYMTPDDRLSSPGDSSVYLPLPRASVPPGAHHQHSDSRASLLSVDSVVGSRNDFLLQKVDPFFTDSKGEFYNAFEKKLGNLSANNSTTDLCIEDYLIKSEKEWFTQYRDARLGRFDRGRASSPDGRGRSRQRSRQRSPMISQDRSPMRSRLNLYTAAPSDDEDDSADSYSDYKEQFGIAEDYVPPTGLKRRLQYRIGDWPIYAILIAIGQIISSNSYQITLLTGEVGQTATKLYIVASIYLVSSIAWYILSRMAKALYVLSLPFVFYGAAFVILGASPLASAGGSRGWVQNVATGLYACASSSGAFAFAFNFGDEGGSPISTWIYRMAVIQGLAQLYALALWAWGGLISAANAAGEAQKYSLANSPWMLAVCVPIALALWAVGLVLFLGLPDYYRETPGPVPMLWKTLVRRKTIAWYMLAVVIQNYFLSSLYGRNWFFLFSAAAVPAWSMVLLALVFFVGCWVLVLWGLTLVSRSHPWLFPLFSVGLGAPRWAQMLWGTSGIGLYLPWAGSAVASAILSRALWLWLGLLDGIQGAGIGMILMLTLTRVHVAAAVVAAQVIGSVATILARATAPDKLGPGDVFPDFSEGVKQGVSKAWFWVVLGLQLMICAGFFKFFRKEQVSKP